MEVQSMVLRSLSLVLILGGIASAAFAQLPVPQGLPGLPGPGGGDRFERAIFIRGGQPPEEVITGVQQALNLSEPQVSGLRALFSVRAETTKGVFPELGEKQRALREVLAQTNPSALDVGNAFLGVQSVEARLRASEERFQTDFQALLNPDQRSTIASLKTASTQIEALRRLGVFGPGDQFEFALPGFAGGGVGAAGFGPMPIPQPGPGRFIRRLPPR
jgi:hypothetical protein